MSGDRALPAQRRRLARQPHERRLRRVLRVMGLAQHAVAHAQHQPRVPPHELLERPLPAGVQVLGQKLPVAGEELLGHGVSTARRTRNIRRKG